MSEDVSRWIDTRQDVFVDEIMVNQMYVDKKTICKMP